MAVRISVPDVACAAAIFPPDEKLLYQIEVGRVTDFIQIGACQIHRFGSNVAKVDFLLQFPNAIEVSSIFSS